LNCMSGHNMFDQGCVQPDGTYYSTPPPNGSLMLNLSSGNVNYFDLNQDNFSENGNQTTEWVVGTPPELDTPYVPTTSPSPAEIILWLER